MRQRYIGELCSTRCSHRSNVTNSPEYHIRAIDAPTTEYCIKNYTIEFYLCRLVTHEQDCKYIFSFPSYQRTDSDTITK